MADSKAAFIWAIRQQESGGNYQAGNPSGATGAYQMLASNIPGWSRAALGHSVTVQEFLDSPAIQDAIADHVLGGYYDKWGPEQAAAAWYAGPDNRGLFNDTRAQPGGPSIAGYVRQVMGRMDQAPANVSLPLSGSAASSTPGSGSSSGTSSSSGGLFSLPGEITGFFSKATDDLSAAAAWFSAFGRVSTWIRAGAAGFGIPLVILGLVLLVLAARPHGRTT